MALSRSPSRPAQRSARALDGSRLFTSARGASEVVKAPRSRAVVEPSDLNTGVCAAVFAAMVAGPKLRPITEGS